jgi:ADP-ribose pyrophosphatase YjhB (NUDIX family)
MRLNSLKLGIYMSDKSYPRSTVGGLIIAPDGSILLVRSKKWKNLWSVPGGKVELGETLVEAFAREILEETSLKVDHVRFAIVQDCIYSHEFWDKRHFIMHDYIADLAAGYSKNDVVLNDEAEEYAWNLPEEALTMSLTQELKILINWYMQQL